MLEKKKLQQKETIPDCTTWSLKPCKFKKKAFQDTAPASLEENTFYPLTQKEGKRYGMRRLSSVIVGPTLCPPKVHTKHPKKKQQQLSINNAAELTQFKDLLKKKEKNEENILTLSAHQPEGVDPITYHSVPMVVKRNDKMLTSSQDKKKIPTLRQTQGQKRIT